MREYNHIVDGWRCRPHNKLHRNNGKQTTYLELDLLPEISIDLPESAISLVVKHPRYGYRVVEDGVADIHTVFVHTCDRGISGQRFMDDDLVLVVGEGVVVELEEEIDACHHLVPH